MNVLSAHGNKLIISIYWNTMLWSSKKVNIYINTKRFFTTEIKQAYMNGYDVIPLLKLYIFRGECLVQTWKQLSSTGIFAPCPFAAGPHLRHTGPGDGRALPCCWQVVMGMLCGVNSFSTDLLTEPHSSLTVLLPVRREHWPLLLGTPSTSLSQSTRWSFQICVCTEWLMKDLSKKPKNSGQADVSGFTLLKIMMEFIFNQMLGIPG